MTYNEALKILDIEDYSEAIFHSNSKGELFYILDYIDMAEKLKGKDCDFRLLFIITDKYAKETWKNPQHWYQHMPRLMKEVLEHLESI